MKTFSEFKGVLVVLVVLAVGGLSYALLSGRERGSFQVDGGVVVPVESVDAVTSTTDSVLPETEQKDIVTRETRERVFVEEWKHANGTVRLYKKDLFQGNRYEGDAAFEQLLIFTDDNGVERVLLDHQPDVNPGVRNIIITEGAFSPRGNFFAVRVRHYESSSVEIFELKNGTLLSFGSQGAYDAWPYWLEDESAIALLRDAAPIDGTQAAIYYSHTGYPGDAKLIKHFEYTESAQGRFIGKTYREGDFLIFEVQTPGDYNPEGESGIAEKYLFNLKTAVLTLLGTDAYFEPSNN